MANAKLLVNSEKEFSLDKQLTTIGRAADNDLSFADDSNVSRFHAEIENREGEFWLSDLGSSNGTLLNGEKISSEKPLFDGDLIKFGGSASTAKVLLAFDESADETEKDSAENSAAAAGGGGAEAQSGGGSAIGGAGAPAASSTVGAAAAPSSSKMPFLLIAAALAVGLAVIFVFAAGVFYFTQNASSDCPATAKIVSPENGEVIKKPTEIKIELRNGGCVRKAFFTLDGEEFAVAEAPDFAATLDPSKFPFLVDGLNHRVQVILEDENGGRMPQASEIALALETIETEAPPEPETNSANEANADGREDSKNSDSADASANVSIVDVNNMSGKILAQFAGGSKYKIGNQLFLQEVQKKTAEYRSPGYSQRAAKYRDVIDTQFIQEKNLAPPLGYILAMSRSKFQPAADSSSSGGGGLWRIPGALVEANAYNGLCGGEPVAAPGQNCAAIASSSYLKDLILRVFEGDVIYGIAAFGMSPEEAAAWKETLPADRSDFWNVIKSPKQREEVARFFAAALVAENPQKFGLQTDRPLSEFYRVYMR